MKLFGSKSPAPFLLIGLGNPDTEYQNNRHNVGFMAVDAIQKAYNFSKTSKKYGGILSEGMVKGKKVFCFKPQSYMNLSGDPAGKLVRFHKIPLENITVFHDELDLPLAKIRTKRGGGNGGHNGLKSLDAHLGADYRRVRIGIDHPGQKHEVSNYVLSDFSKDERDAVDRLLEEIATNLPLLLQGDDAAFMTKLALGTK